MERHKCKICYRKFANGRALGGHMRSHMMNLPIPPPKPPSYETESWTESSSSSSSSEDEDLGEIEKGLADNYKLRENPRKSSKIADVEFSSLGSSSISVTLREERERKSPSSISETTSSMSPATASSMSDVTSEEDVALCLMMLSRDNWVSGGGGKERFKCYTCGKVFKSYQALGGHRASHNKLRPPAKAPAIPGSDPVKQFKVHECPVCLRVFASAQALGGHKRAHSVNAKHGSQFIRAESDSEIGSLFHIKKITKFKSRANGVRKGKKIVSLIHMEIDTDFKRSNGPCLNRVRVDTDFNTSSNDLHQSPRNDGMIDLNLPAPVDQDDEISQVSFS